MRRLVRTPANGTQHHATFNTTLSDVSSYGWGDGAADEAVRMARENHWLAIDTETAGLNEDRLTLKAISIGTPTRALLLDPNRKRDRAAAREVIDRARTLVMHNAPFDCFVLNQAGLLDAGQAHKIQDTLLLARHADPSRSGHDLDTLAGRHLGTASQTAKGSFLAGAKVAGLTKAEAFKRYDLSSDVYRFYAANDPLLTAQLYDEPLWDALTAHLAADPPRAVWRTTDSYGLMEREHRVLWVTLAASMRGIRFDFEASDDVVAGLRVIINECAAKLIEAGIDPTIGMDKAKRAVVEYLDSIGMIPASWPRLQNGGLSAKKTWLENVDHELVDTLERWSVSTRFVRDYVDGTIDRHLVDEYLHPQVNVCGASTTGRMTMSNPNLQQFPPEVRRMLTVDEPITSLDWSQIEPATLAAMSHDEAMLDSYQSGEDLYARPGEIAGVGRDAAKIVVLASMYGLGVPSLSMKLQVTEEKAKEIQDAVWAAAPTARRMLNGVKEFAAVNGVVRTLLGRTLNVPPDYKRPGRFAGYKASNYVIQGSAYDLLASAIARIHDAGLGDAIVLAIHDELVCLTEAADDIDRIMQTPPPELEARARRSLTLRTSRADLGSHWKEKK